MYDFTSIHVLLMIVKITLILLLYVMKILSYPNGGGNGNVNLI